MTYYKELTSNRRIFHVGSTGLEIVIYPDKETGLPRMTKEERDDFNIKRRIENLIAKSVDNRDDFNHLLSIPSKVGIKPLDIFSDILKEKLKPQEAKAKLLELERYHTLLWRG